MSLTRWLFGDDTLPNWTPQRAQQAEREMLRREGIVTEPHYLWSAPAKAREQQAKARRELSWRKAYLRPERVARFWAKTGQFLA